MSSIVNDRLAKIAVTGGILAVLSLAGSRVVPFAGWPLTDGELVATILVLVAVWGCTKIKKRLLVGIVAVLFVIAGLKLIGSTLIHEGWSVCFVRGVSQNFLWTPCEPSASFRDGSRTFIEPGVAWRGRGFPLYFMNRTPDFNFSPYIDPTQPDRNALPYTARVSGYIAGQQASRLTLDTTLRDVDVAIDGRHVVVSNETSTFDLPKGSTHFIAISYTARRSDADTLIIRVSQPVMYDLVHGGVPRTVWVRFYCVIYWVLLVSLLGFIVVNYVSGLLFNDNDVRRYLLICAAGVLALVVAPSVPFWLFTVVVLFIVFGASWHCLDRPNERRLWISWAVALSFLTTALFVGRLFPPPHLALPPGGGDELGHESFARSVLLARTWHAFLVAQENMPFYYQPLYRYLLAGLHYLTGEDVWGVFVVQTWLLILAIWIAVGYLGRQFGRTTMIVFGALIGIFMAWRLSDTSLLLVPLSTYQQALGVPILLLATCLVLWQTVWERGDWWICGGSGLLLGLAIGTRTDYLPVIPGLLLALAWSVRHLERRQIFVALSSFCLGLAIPLAAIVWRNYTVAHQLILMPTSSLINLLPQFQPLVSNVAPTHGSRAILLIIRDYSGHYVALIDLLLSNIRLGFMGLSLSRTFLWVIGPFMAVIGVWIGSSTARSVLGILLALLAPTISIDAFFAQHNGIAMMAHLDFLWILLIAIAFGQVVKRWQLITLGVRFVRPVNKVIG